MIKREFKITAFVPREASVTECKQFIEDALCCHGGAFHPCHPLFESFKEIKAIHKPIKKETK